ncbi:hypothetical protein [Actinocrispum sp. NPDC049592]
MYATRRLRTAFPHRRGEKGPHRPVDTAAGTRGDIAATSGSDLADQLGC